MNKQDKIVQETFDALKRENRRGDVVQFLCELENCKSFEQIKELADWYKNKPRFD